MSHGDLSLALFTHFSLFEARTPALLVADPEFIKHVLVKDFYAMARRRVMYHVA